MLKLEYQHLLDRLVEDPLVEAAHVWNNAVRPWMVNVSVDFRRPLGADGSASFQRAVDICRGNGNVRYLTFTQPQPGGPRHVQDVVLTEREPVTYNLMTSGSTT